MGDGGEGEDGREGEGEGKDEGGEGEEGDDNDGDGDGEGDAEAGDGITIDAVDTGRQGRSLSGREWRQRAMNWCVQWAHAYQSSACLYSTSMLVWEQSP